MTDSQSHIVGTWTLNLCFWKGPVSFRLQVSSCLPFILLSVMLTALSFFSLNPFNLLSFPFRFILCLFSSIYLSLPPWPLFICPPLVFPSSQILLYPPTTTVPPLSFTVTSFFFCSPIFEFHWCSFASVNIPVFSSSFTSLITASIADTCSFRVLL